MTLASCTASPMPDMVVETKNESVSDLRRGIIELFDVRTSARLSDLSPDRALRTTGRLSEARGCH